MDHIIINESDIKNKDLKNLLKSHDVLDIFIKNTNHHTAKAIQEDNISDKVASYAFRFKKRDLNEGKYLTNIFTEMFDWKKSPEGLGFWWNIENEWQIICDNHR